MGTMLGIVYRAIATHLIRKVSFSAERARTGTVTLIQRFGYTLNDQDLICRAAAWRIRSVELSRCIQNWAAWGFEGFAFGCAGSGEAP